MPQQPVGEESHLDSLETKGATQSCTLTKAWTHLNSYPSGP